MTTDTNRPAPSVTVRGSGPVRDVVIGSGTRRNALTGGDWQLLGDAVRSAGDDDSTRVVVVRGRGGTFCAGSDMTEWLDADTELVEDSFARMEAAFRAVERCPVPVVAEIRGVAAGAGCQLALACDLRLIADSARIGMPIARLGINASPSFAARMVALAGPATTRRMLYTGTLLDAPKAVSSGLADEQAPDAELADLTARTAARIAEQPTAAVRAAKRAVSAALSPVRTATAHNDQDAVSPAEFHHAVAAFVGRS